MAAWILVAMVTTGMLVDAAVLGNHQTLSEKASHHYDELKRILEEIKKSDFGNLPNVINALINGHNNKSIDVINSSRSFDSDISSLVLRSLMHTTSFSIDNSGGGETNNINVYNNVTFNLSYRGRKSKTDKSDRPDSKTEDSNTDASLSSSKFRHAKVDAKSVDSKSWMDTLVRPLNFTVKRDGDVVKLTFDVFRTERASVSHSWTYEGEKQFMKGPGDYGIDNGMPIASLIEFSYDTSTPCKLSGMESSSSRKRQQYLFSKRDANKVEGVTFTFFTCIFNAIDTLGKANKDSDAFMSNERQGMANNQIGHWDEQLSQVLQYPDYWKRMNVSPITAMPGKNVTLEFEIDMAKEDSFYIEGVFYDWNSGKFDFSNFIALDAYSGKLNVQRYNREFSARGMYVEILDQKTMNGSMPGLKYPVNGKDESFYVKASLRLTVTVEEDDDISGILNLSHTNDVPPSLQLMKILQSPPTKIAQLRITKGIKILKSNQEEPFPKGKFLTHTQKRFQCGAKGAFSTNMGFGNNCVFMCSVSGVDVKHVRARRLRRGNDNPIVEKYMEVLPYSAFTIVNLGPARKEVDGEYECKVADNDGNKLKWKVEVRTWGFPSVTEDDLQANNDSDSYTFTCAATSTRQPLNVTAFLSSGMDASTSDTEERTRIDNNPSVKRKIAVRGNETRMTITIPSQYLRWPNEAIVCVVDNDAGTDSDSAYLNDYSVPDYYLHTDHPHLMKNRSTVTDHGNGKTTVMCTATGKHPLVITFHIDERFDGSGTEVKGDSMNTITYEQSDDELVATLEIPTVDLQWPRSTVSCKARNDVGEVRIDFDLSRFIDQTH